MLQALDRLSGTDEAARAAPGGFALLAHGDAVAFRAAMRKVEGLAPARTLFLDDAHDLRNDIAGALDDHRVADTDVLALDLVFIVQGRAANDDAAHRDGLEIGDRRQRAASADIDEDVVDHGLRLLCREFMRDSPTRRAADEAQALLEIEVVDLVDHAVDVIGQARALLADVAMKGKQLIDAAAKL